MQADSIDFDESKYVHADITKAIIGATLEVDNQLGYGFLEKVYQLAIQVELIARKLSTETAVHLPVRYKGVTVGEYYTDILVSGEVLVELKVAASYQRADEAQLLNALKASQKRVGSSSISAVKKSNLAASIFDDLICRRPSSLRSDCV